MAEYGVRVRDASGVDTLNTSTTVIRTLAVKRITVPPLADRFFSYVNMPEVTAECFVVASRVDVTGERDTMPGVFWSVGQLQIKLGAGLVLDIFILRG